MTNKAVNELTNHEIDYLVAKIEKISYMREVDGAILGLGDERKIFVKVANNARMYPFSPTMDWRIAGQIIQRERISIQPFENYWLADIGREVSATDAYPLVAAMRALVIAHLGHTPNLD